MIPARDEAHSIERLLRSLVSQTVPPAEIIVVDGGSTDATASVARSWEGRGVRVLEIGPAYPGRGRNKGIEAATQEWIGLIDAGCVADPAWLESLLATRDAAGEDVGAVFGNYEPELRSAWDVAQAAAIVPPPDAATGCRPMFIASSLVRRSAWRAAGGFPEALRAAEDLLFFEALGAAGVRVVRSPEARITWTMAASPGAMFRRLRLYSRHHLAAGLYRTWHVRVMAIDTLLGSLAGLGFVNPLALALPVAIGAARVLRATSRRQANIAPRNPFEPALLARAAVLLLLADLATWAGVLDYARERLGRGRFS